MTGASPVDLEAARDLLVEAEGIEAHYGPNPYVDYLRRHKKRPPPNEAAIMGKAMGGRVRADNGKLYPIPSKKAVQERRQRQAEHNRLMEAAPWPWPWPTVANDNQPGGNSGPGRRPIP